MKGYLHIAALAVLVGLAPVTSNSANAGGLASAFRDIGGTVAKQQRTANVAPLAYQLFCLQNKRECQSGGTGKAQHTAKLLRTLNQVNRSVNRSIRFTDDRSETWQANVRKGDCEDFALTKRSKLIRLGVPAGALRVAVARNSKGVGHAVLVVKTTKGDLVLDNARQNIVSREKTGYRWIAMASANPTRWNKL